MTNNSKNIYWINAVKAIAILAVYLSHVQSSAFYGYSIGKVHSFISPWYVNAFFIISGYLLFRKQLSEPLISECRSLYISRNGGGYKLFINILSRIVFPTILFSIIVFVPNGILRGKTMDIPYFLYKTFGGGTAWFTSALAVSELILLFLFISRQKNIWFYAVACFVLGGLGMALQHGPYQYEIWACHRGVLALIYIAIGGLYWKYEKKISILMRWYVIVFILIVYVAIILFCKNTTPIVTLLELKPLGILTTILSCLLLIELCKVLPKNRILNYIGQNTLGIYLISGAVPSVICPIMQKLIPGSHLWVMLLSWLLCLATACFIVQIINRWMPWMFDFQKIKIQRK